MRKFVKAGLTAATALGLVFGSAVSASATGGSVDIVPFEPNTGWLSCIGFGRAGAVGTLHSAGAVMVNVAGESTGWHFGTIGMSRTHISHSHSGRWTVYGTANGNGFCD